jgi:hypothetical protein
MDTFNQDNKDKIKCWIYGHTHAPSNAFINRIPFLCNLIGYAYENFEIDYNKTITIYTDYWHRGLTIIGGKWQKMKN